MAAISSPDRQNLDRIFPKLEVDWIKKMVDNYNQMHDVELPTFSKIQDIDELDEKIKKILYEVFVSRTLASKFAVKYRFLNFMKYAQTWSQFELVDEEGLFGELHVDLILRDPQDKSLVWVLFNEIMSDKILHNFRSICAEVRGGKASEVAAKIVFVSAKSYREIPMDDPITIKIAGNQDQTWSAPFEIWIEEKNPERPFTDNDLLIVRDAEFAGFNFSSINDLVDVIKSSFGDGQYEILRVPNFFGQKSGTKTFDTEVIWKGIIFPRKVFK